MVLTSLTIIHYMVTLHKWSGDFVIKNIASSTAGWLYIAHAHTHAPPWSDDVYAKGQWQWKKESKTEREKSFVKWTRWERPNLDGLEKKRAKGSILTTALSVNSKNYMR